MIGNDFKAIKKCFDLKGSLFNRITDITQSEVETGPKTPKPLQFRREMLFK